MQSNDKKTLQSNDKEIIILISRYCGYVLGQPTDLTCLLDILESSSSSLSLSSRDHLKNLLHSQLQNQKETSDQGITRFSLIDGLFNQKRIVCNVNVDNADHLSLVLLMDRYLLLLFCNYILSFHIPFISLLNS